MYLIVRYDEPRYAYLSLKDGPPQDSPVGKGVVFNIPSDARPTDIGVTDGLECAVAFDGVDFWGPFKNFDAANYWLRTTRGHGWEEPEPTVSAYFIGSQKPSQFWRARMKRRWRTVAKIIQRIRRCYRKRSIGTPMGDIKMHFH